MKKQQYNFLHFLGQYRQILNLVMIAFVFWLIAFYHSIITAVDIWASLDIFNHCFFVLPVSLYLIYLKREELRRQPIKPNYWLVPILLILVFIQVFGYAGDIKILMHFSAFTFLPLLLWFLLGNKLAYAIMFPLFFMVFAIPVGEQLIPLLQEITADLSVYLLEKTGIPIYRNGLYIEIPAGKFLVAEACSGISFFVGSVVFGNLYAYLSYQSLRRKFFFLVLVLMIPIGANALRVFGIIMIAYWTDMEHAVGADHLVYGFFFYAIILFLLIIVGESLRTKQDRSVITPEKITRNEQNKLSQKLPVSITVCILMAAALWQASMDKPLKQETDFTVDNQLKSLVAHSPLTDWTPNFINANNYLSGKSNDNDGIEVYVAWYDGHGVEGELVSSQNRTFHNKKWTLISNKKVAISVSETELIDAVLTTVTSVHGEERQILHWYMLDNYNSGNRTKVKLMQTLNKILNQSPRGAYIAISKRVGSTNTQEELMSWVKQYNAMLKS